jgi:hypothetical protein
LSAIALIHEMYNVFSFDFAGELSTKPEEALGTIEPVGNTIDTLSRM